MLIAKDRPGQLRKHARPHSGLHWFGDFVMESDPIGFNDTVLLPPTDEVATTAAARPAAIMRKVSDLLAQNPRGLSKNAVETSIGGRREYVRLALELLVNEGHVAQTKRGNATLHTLVKPFSEDI